jgi:hypothetical protein
MVVSEDTAPELLANVEFLRGEGFRTLSFHVNVVERWSEGGLRTLERAVAGVGRYAKTLKPGQLDFPHLRNYAAPSLEHDDDQLVLGADGNYYPCDGLFAAHYAKLSRWTVGSAREGVDWKKRAALLGKAREEIHSLLNGRPHFNCPQEPYFRALALGRAPAEDVRAFHRADAVFGEALSAWEPAHAR